MRISLSLNCWYNFPFFEKRLHRNISVLDAVIVMTNKSYLVVSKTTFLFGSKYRLVKVIENLVHIVQIINLMLDAVADDQVVLIRF